MLAPCEGTVAAGLLVAAGPGHHRLGHVLLRDAVYERVPAAGVAPRPGTRRWTPFGTRAAGSARRGERARLTGELTVRGTTAPVDLVIESVALQAHRTDVRVTVRIDRRLFPVGPACSPIGRYLTVKLTVILTTGR